METARNFVFCVAGVVRKNRGHDMILVRPVDDRRIGRVNMNEDQLEKYMRMKNMRMKEGMRAGMVR